MGPHLHICLFFLLLFFLVLFGAHLSVSTDERTNERTIDLPHSRERVRDRDRERESLPSVKSIGEWPLNLALMIGDEPRWKDSNEKHGGLLLLL